jgi:hypothetical protein
LSSGQLGSNIYDVYLYNVWWQLSGGPLGPNLYNMQWQWSGKLLGPNPYNMQWQLSGRLPGPNIYHVYLYNVYWQLPSKLLGPNLYTMRWQSLGGFSVSWFHGAELDHTVTWFEAGEVSLLLFGKFLLSMRINGLCIQAISVVAIRDETSCRVSLARAMAT